MHKKEVILSWIIFEGTLTDIFNVFLSFYFRFTCTKAYKNLLNELGDQAGQHELIAENLSTTVVLELATLVKQLKDDRRKVRVDGDTSTKNFECSARLKP